MEVKEGRRRVVVSGVDPEIDCGRFPVKRTVGEEVVVEADVFADGHDAVRAVLRYRAEDERDWSEVPMEPLVNDRWRGSFRIDRLVDHRYTVRGWVDRFATWRGDLAKRVAAGQDVRIELLEGADLIDQGARRATGPDGKALRRFARRVREGGRAGDDEEGADAVEAGIEAALDPEVDALMAANPDRRFAGGHGRELVVRVDRELARFGAWYEMFPRSAAQEAGRHGTFADVETLLPHVAGMGFDVLYLPPIHPIGTTHRKGPNNAEVAGPGDPGSPWGIGSKEGGLTAIHPELGKVEDLDRLVAAAREHGLEIALDLAYQCSPDHPWVTEHPEWFRHRGDGSIRYAENPPKRYQDIYPLDFETEDWRGLWEALKDVATFWIAHGVRIFRVDNPHTKAFPFWEWMIEEVRA
ncbi:MAG: DUF3416 domain-containing protein, partial [Actinobacteria bacterium]|nr:DUF3416 domain-containing protein [Actinomycetota bacterium]